MLAPGSSWGSKLSWKYFETYQVVIHRGSHPTDPTELPWMTLYFSSTLPSKTSFSFTDVIICMFLISGPFVRQCGI